MKRIKTLLQTAVGIVSVTAIALSMTACGGHKHKWVWRHSDAEHWQICAKEECGQELEKSRASHDISSCETCITFRVLAFGVVTNVDFDAAHADFAREANQWFKQKGEVLGFSYTHTTDWNDLNDENLAKYELVMFLNDKPTQDAPRAAFQRYMENGGAWMGYHSAAFEMKSIEKNIWDWYHKDFLGSGEYWKNTWNPTGETLHVETQDHFSTSNLPETFLSAPNEWYAWEAWENEESDLYGNPDITVLLTLDKSTFPVGNNPNKPNEIWTKYNYYPVAWTNQNYKMVYMNMGHNLQNYNDFEKESKTFSQEWQNRFVLDSMFGLINS